MLVRRTPRLRTYALAAAGASTIVSPLLALSWFATADGAEFAEQATVALWADPARSLAGGLLTFSGPDRVYATYTQVMALLFPAIPLVALAARSARPGPGTRPERWGWRLATAGYVVFAAGLLAAALLLTVDSTAPGLGVVFVAAMLPGLLLSLIGSTTLGIALLRGGYRPRATAWLLALSVPLWILGGVVLGHNSLGVVPLFVAWAVTASRWSPASPRRSTQDLTPATGRFSVPRDA